MADLQLCSCHSKVSWQRIRGATGGSIYTLQAAGLESFLFGFEVRDVFAEMHNRW
jgi:hypothetical protein